MARPPSSDPTSTAAAAAAEAAAGDAASQVATVDVSSLPDNTACPRCGGEFRCGVDDGHCACFGTRLSEALKRDLAARYPGQCLCMACLTALARLDPESYVPPRPAA